ncbi:hypothetical protein [Anaerotruncus sp. DFI.9.16]|uniref:hypothetical protein n=1 Tax=Anaerotruncus sp. DFI.9.16 TaxID=2965275 RepID=UPI00210A0FDF|nr:hypothetical protein [Anaerotruncus sp. DFI.9.16]MCQ4894949.1 hypothetical protein [Anaerotruncus sp. DFI.9.16]
MKFQKFVKAIGSDGIVFNRKNGERWLASDRVFMKIPEDIRSITASEITDMPDSVEGIINFDSFTDSVEGIINFDRFTDPCELHKAVMPYADGVIKDCVRIYATENALNTVAIDNSSYALIERKDIVEMFCKYNSDDETSEGKALVIKRPSDFTSDEEVVGLIFPTDYEE